MAMEAAPPKLESKALVDACGVEQSLPVASLLTMSAGFLDAFTWLSLGGVFGSSQTGNVVFLGMYAASGHWHQAAHHLLPILGFLTGASVAIRLKAPLLCLGGEIVCLVAVMLTLHRISEPVAIIGISFGSALQSASFRHVGRLNYLSVAVTGNMFRTLDQFAAIPRAEAARGAVDMLTICLTFVLGAAVGGWATLRFDAASLALPITLSTFALWLCRRRRAI
ncbi:YoaK family protein [Bradyrhizobium sp. Cp5.3]|uniref:YoaK family protein n=1 Tax=Bradyrhizobium sp. Cp5.3 TaxID=443598 RepID=UPI0003F5D417|nr:YoaK family protein [Bradyrhizobium sp. Cp5.3]